MTYAFQQMFCSFKDPEMWLLISYSDHLWAEMWWMKRSGTKRWRSMNMWLVQKLCTTGGLHPPGTKDFGMKEIKMTVLFWNGNAYNTAVYYLIIEDKMLPMATGYRISVQGFVRCKDNRSFRSKQEINLSEGGKICKIISLAPLAVFKQTSHNWSEIGGKNQEN